MAKLFLIPTTLSNIIDHNALLPYQLPYIKHLKHFVVETSKTARLHLKQLNLDTLLQQLDIQELNKHQQHIGQLIQPLLNGFDMGLISDCGLPAIADPGSQLIALAHKNKVTVIPLVGPSSIMLALMSSGVNGQNFSFNGYLPIEATERKNKIKLLAEMIIKFNQSQIFIETPFRNQELLQTLITTLVPNIILAVTVNLMQHNQQIISQPISQWQKLANLPQLQKQEAVFIIGLNN